MITAGEDEDLAATGVVRGERQRHQVGLGAGVREAHLFDRREPLDDHLGEAHLVRVDGAERPATVDRGVSSGSDRLGGVAEQPGGVVAEEVDVAVPVDVDEVLGLRRRDAEREGVEVQHRSCVAAGEDPARSPRPLGAVRVGLGVAPASLDHGRVERGDG